MNEWYSGIYKAFILASAITFMISFFSTGMVSWGSIIAGYSALILGIMMILLILFISIFKVTQGNTTLQIIISVLMTTGPFLLMLGIIGFILYLIIFYKNNIVRNRVSPSYYTFSNIAIILLLLQIYMVYTNISSDRFANTGKMSQLTSSIIYLLDVIVGMCSLILFTILKYFTTDG